MSRDITLLKNCTDCWAEILLSNEKRLKRAWRNKCNQCHSIYSKEYAKKQWYKYAKKYIKTDGGKEAVKRSVNNIYIKNKVSKSEAKALYMKTDEYKNKVEYQRLHTYISNKRIGIYKWALKRWISYDKDLTTEYIFSLCESIWWKCMASWIGLTCWWDVKYNTLSIDRIDSTKWYTKDNIQIVCYMYNVMKSTFTDSECLSFANALVKKQISVL